MAPLALPITHLFFLLSLSPVNTTYMGPELYLTQQTEFMNLSILLKKNICNSIDVHEHTVLWKKWQTTSIYDCFKLVIVLTWHLCWAMTRLRFSRINAVTFYLEVDHCSRTTFVRRMYVDSKNVFVKIFRQVATCQSPNIWVEHTLLQHFLC